MCGCPPTVMVICWIGRSARTTFSILMLVWSGLGLTVGHVPRPRGGLVNTGALVEHDNVLCDDSHTAPGAVLLGEAEVGSGTLVGSGARVLSRCASRVRGRRRGGRGRRRPRWGCRDRRARTSHRGGAVSGRRQAVSARPDRGSRANMHPALLRARRGNDRVDVTGSSITSQGWAWSGRSWDLPAAPRASDMEALLGILGGGPHAASAPIGSISQPRRRDFG